MSVMVGSVRMYRVDADGRMHEVPLPLSTERRRRRLSRVLAPNGLNLARPHMKDRARRRRAGLTRSGVLR